MLTVKLCLGVVILGLATLLIGGGASEADSAPISSQPGTIKEVSEEASQKVAEEFLKNSPTFVFDGIEDTLRLTDPLMARCPCWWKFTFEFDCKHAGHGDRTGQVLAEVITHHEAGVTVDQGEVTGAIMDEKWDMIDQTIVEPVIIRTEEYRVEKELIHSVECPNSRGPM